MYILYTYLKIDAVGIPVVSSCSCHDGRWFDDEYDDSRHYQQVRQKVQRVELKKRLPIMCMTNIV